LQYAGGVNKCVPVIFLAVAAAGCGGNQAASSLASESEGSRAIGNDRQQAVAYECFYALRSSWRNPPNTTGPTAATEGSRAGIGSSPVVSNWNYIGDDPNAFSVIAGKMGDNSSVCPFFGTGSSYGTYQGFGRGGECLFFANLILFRSRFTTKRAQYYSWSSLTDSGVATAAKVGDLIFRVRDHVMVCVKRNSDGSADIVESNWASNGKTSPNLVAPSREAPYNTYCEIIGRRNLSATELKNWRFFDGNHVWYGTGSS
jgi:hypothetical protein